MSANDIHTGDTLAPDSPRTHIGLDDPYLLSDATARELLAVTPWRRFAVIGDSTAAATGDPSPGYETISWADRLARWFLAAHPGTDYLNTGRMGATIPEVRAGQLAALHDFHPDLVHITCGGNDLIRRDGDLIAVEKDLDALCDSVAATGARLSMFTLADAFTGPLRPLRPRFAGFADSVRRVAARHDAILTEFWAHPARLREDWLSADHIHLTMAGQAVVAAELAKSFARHADSGHGGQ
ncbi:SGNH/GDSL hydrolase family protein [Nocardia sp. SYP-A9097]|uniref:SGNH/GDSL hydrolase family protein n=1 Tax=Nocardia sp. SYP-A9097 TaxID=2663237 RepID=UPI00129BDDE2|nr:SGNH/GDSL hydrolase family protein [Nocardia sp. SYP-A9097]MRH90146.1 SGNH/GDSL hydrolase family protein [Nocardia sp. SYP-A9097]